MTNEQTTTRNLSIAHQLSNVFSTHAEVNSKLYLKTREEQAGIEYSVTFTLADGSKVSGFIHEDTVSSQFINGRYKVSARGIEQDNGEEFIFNFTLIRNGRASKSELFVYPANGSRKVTNIEFSTDIAL